MYRIRLEEIRKEKELSTKKWSELSGVSVDTINRIRNPENPEKDSPRINTLEDLCKPLGVEIWEIFFIGDKSFMSLQAEYDKLLSEANDLRAENVRLKDENASLKAELDRLRLTLEHKEEMLAHKQQIVELQEQLLRLHKTYAPGPDGLKF